MKCPNCKKKMKRNFCIYCGYMNNGNFINNKPFVIKGTDLELFLGKRFDVINRNKNLFTVFLLGPFYFCFNRLILLGVLAFFLDIFYYILFFIIMKILFPLFSDFYMPIAFFINRLFYLAMANFICLRLLNLKIMKIKKKYPDNYQDILIRKSEEHFSFIQLIIGILIVLLIIAIIFNYLRN